MKKIFFILVLAIFFFNLNISKVLAYTCAQDIKTGFAYPIGNWRESCGFDVYCAKDHHMGIDGVPLSGEVVGTPVLSPCTGVVKEAQSHDGYGGMVILECWTGSECVSPFVAHMFNTDTTVGEAVYKGLQVAANDSVSVGDVLGYLADENNNGGYYGPHSHFGIRKGAAAVSSNYTICDADGLSDDWVWYYAGYPYNCYEEMLPDMYPPDEFISDHPSDNTPGMTDQGWDTSFSAVVFEAYSRNGGQDLVGDTFDDNGGGYFLHSWYDLKIQNFRVDENSDEYAIITATDLLNDSNANPASVVRSGFWSYYGNNDGPLGLGVPLGDEMDETNPDYGYDPECDMNGDEKADREERDDCIDSYCGSHYSSVQRFELGYLCFALGITYQYGNVGDLVLATSTTSGGVDSDGDGLSDEEEEIWGTRTGDTDTDSDNLSDGEEVYTYGTNPDDPDSDDDGLEDYLDVGIGLNPRDPDTDDDGLSDGYEINNAMNAHEADEDGDGLADGEEVAFGTSMNDSDSDDDGLNDGSEVHTYGTIPTDADTDNDNLTDKQEIDLGYDPLLSDADADGLNDGGELAAGTARDDPDSDDDGLSDGNEVHNLGTDPLDSDTDNDGLNDAYENSNIGYDPLNPDVDGDGFLDGGDPDPFVADPDSDGDGLTDSEEISLGTDVSNVDSDGDGIIDGDEVHVYGTNPTSADSDGDGLGDYQEVILDGMLEVKLVPNDGLASDSFGKSVSLDGDWAVIGTPDDDDKGNGSGSTYVYHWDGTIWVEEAKLLASDGQAGDHFGYRVAIDGDWIAVGAYGDDDKASEAGAVYVFHQDNGTWSQYAKLTASDGTGGDGFGRSVCVANDLIIVGAPEEDGVLPGEGAVYVYRLVAGAWIEEAKIMAEDADSGEYFGYSVSSSHDQIIVGAPEEDGVLQSEGAVYVYQFVSGEWTLETKIKAENPGTLDNFGYSVSVSDNRLIAGAYNDTEGEINSGSASIFVHGESGWTQETKITSSDGENGDKFGISVSINGDAVVVGASGDDDTGSGSGAAYVFWLEGGKNWQEKAKLLSPTGLAQDEFGKAVSLDNSRILIGAFGADILGSNSGAASIFDVSSLLVDSDQDGDGYRESDGDCNDNDATVYSTAMEACDGIDNNCDSIVDPDCDDDGDGVTNANELAEGSNPNDPSSTACVPPSSATDWIVTHDCIFINSKTFFENLFIQNGAVMTIPTGVSLDLDFGARKLVVQNGSGVLIQHGGSLH